MISDYDMIGFYVLYVYVAYEFIYVFFFFAFANNIP